MDRVFRRHPVLSLVTLAYLAFVGWVTLSPELPMGEGTDGFVWTVLDLLDRVPGARWIDYSDVEFVANIGMFAPIGMFFVLLFGRGRWWLAILLGFVISAHRPCPSRGTAVPGPGPLTPRRSPFRCARRATAAR